MTKITENELSCEALKKAYERANRSAFESGPGTPPGATWDVGTYGYQVTGKGTAIGKDACTECGKNITVTLNFPKIEARDSKSGNPVNLFDTAQGSSSINVSGHKCSENESQR